MEANIRERQSKLDRSGLLIKNKRATLVSNLLLSVFYKLERRQLAII